MPVERIARSAAESALWGRIEAHVFEPPGHPLTFTSRLARDHGWSLAEARRAVEEYRRFVFLAMTSTTPMTPSQEVDEVWHLHLTFSRDYWDVWCGTVLGASLHHDPTTGSRPDARRFADQYARTLARYEVFFGPPDAAFWPGVAERFGGAPRFRTVDGDRAIVIPLPRRWGPRLRRAREVLALSTLLSLLTSGPARALPLDVLDWPGEPFLVLYGALAVLAVASAFLLGALFRRDRGGRAQTADLSPLDLALLAGGHRRAADMAALALIESGHLAVDPHGRLAAATTGDGALDATGAALYRRAGAGPLKRKDLTDALADPIAAAQARLARSGLVLGQVAMGRLRLLQLCVVGPVVLLGGAKIVVGLSRGKPVGFLVAMTIAMLFVSVILADKSPIATAAGRRRLAAFKADHLRLLRAPLPYEVTTAFAITGTAALVGTTLAHASPFFAPSGGGGGDGGGGCGGGGGGGGCGGCGGGH